MWFVVDFIKLLGLVVLILEVLLTFSLPGDMIVWLLVIDTLDCGFWGFY